MRRPLLALALFAAACPAPATAPPPQAPHVVQAPPPPPPPPQATTSDKGLEPPEPTLRLPKNFVPTEYQARLAIDPKQPTFSGSITITGNINERSSVIWLHGRHLNVSKASATATTGDPVATAHGIASALTVTPHGEDLLEVRAETPLDPGTWQIALDYTGQIDDINTTGAFRETVAGAQYVYSQFEAIYARRVFPCVDEPDTKVPWQLTLDVPKDLVAVTNTSEVETLALGEHAKRVTFAKTKPLPSYLIAFGVGPFDVVDAGKTHSGTPVRIIALKGRANDAQWAAKTTPRVVDLLEEWFGMPYPFEKLDMLAVPTTVGFGAMENAGLVTFAERTGILQDPAHPSWQRKRRWVAVASHELAHQWFGDYVTTAWWDDIWLNEGFADWMQTKITARFEPAWHEELGELSLRDTALGADSVVSARRIRQPIEKTGDILNAFDGITYDKGASVLNMFESYVGAEVFQKGVREYLHARAYGNATSADFIAAVSAASGKDLAPALSSFLDQAGAPELDASIACTGGPPRIEISQHRYVPPGSPAPPEGKPWTLPVCVVYEKAGKRAEACAFVEQAKATVPLDTKSCPRWAYANVRGRGYYRVAPVAKSVIALRDEAWPQLQWTERRALFFDVSAAADTGKLPLQLALSFVPKMLTGGDRFTVGDALGLPLALERFVADDQRAKYEAWLRTTFGPGATALGVLPKQNEDLDAESERESLFHAAAWSGRDPELVTQAVAAADHWRDLPPSMRGSILAVAVDASAEIFERVLHDVRSEPDRIRRGEMYGALGAVRDVKRFESALQLLLDPSLDIRETSTILFSTSVEATRAAGEKFYRDHEQELLKRMPQDEVAGGLWRVANLFVSACDARRRDEIADFVQKHFGVLPGGERVARQAIESMDQCIASRGLLDPELRAWLGGFKLPRPEAKKDTKKDKDIKPKKR